jgi:two-component system CitB family sensor kinase
VKFVQSWSVSARLFATQLLFIVLFTGVATVMLWADARSDAEDDAAERCLAIATSIAANPFVLEALQSDDPSVELQPYAVEIMDDTGTDFVTILDTDRTRYTHPNPQEIGRQFLGTIGPALDGETFTEIYSGTLGPSVRAVVPIVDDEGDVVAIAAAGVTVSTVSVALGGRLPIVFGAAGATILIGAFGSWLLSRYLRRVTWGRGPEEMARMFAYYESVLHSVREGLMLVDPDGRLVLYNDQAAELLRLPFDRSPTPTPTADLDLSEPLRRLLGSGERAVDEVYLTDDRVLVVNQEVAVSTVSPARVLGTVTTLRDHTELRQLSGELQTMRTLSDALRSQTHEFSNRLHTIVALIELGRPESALEFAANELDSGQDLADQLLGAIDEPVLAALLLGKSAQANERGIDLRVDVDSTVGHLDLPANDLVTIVGNLIDNAMDAVSRAIDGLPSATQTPRVILTVSRPEPHSSDVVIRVADNGPGVPDTNRIFQRGYTTKTVTDRLHDGGRGVGLALVGQTVRRLGGTITVESDSGAVFTVRLPQ